MPGIVTFQFAEHERFMNLCLNLQELEVQPIGTIEHVYAMAHMALGESRALKVLPRGEWEEYDVQYPRR